MKMTTRVSLIILLPLLSCGCGEFGVGGGAYQPTSVVVLPPNLSGSGEAADPGAAGNTDAGDESTSQGPGSFAGRVVLSGSAPSLPLIHAKGASIKDAETCAAEDMPNEALVLGEGNGVANVFVYLARPPKGSPKLQPVDEAVVFDQKNCRFLPHCMIIPVGQTVKVLSDDGIAHNTHTNPQRSTGISQGVSPNDRTGSSLQFAYKAAEKEPCRITCDFHGWMLAWHFPVDHPYIALTDENGNFEIPNIPSGDYVFTVWHEAAKNKKRKLKVSIKPGETTTQEIEYAASQLAL